MTLGPLLLNDSHLEGVHSIKRALGPPRLALAINKRDLSDATNAINELCLVWGGAAGALIPADAGTDQLDLIWRDQLDSGMFDEFCTRELVRGNEDILGTAVHDYIGGASVFSMAHGTGRKREDWAVVCCDLPEPEHPWYGAYLGCLGSWPEAIPESNLRAAGMREGLKPEDFFPVERGTVSEPSAADLVSRLRGPDLYPAKVSILELGVARGPRLSGIGDTQTLPFYGWNQARFGPNFVVVYTPGDPEDLALLWNFRAGHGAPAHVPLAAPEASAIDALRLWMDLDGGSFALRLFGLEPGKPWGLISSSVSSSRLKEIAAEVGSNWTVSDAAEMLPAGDRAARVSTDVATFSGGLTRFLSMAPADRDLWRGVPGHETLYLRASPQRRELPPIKKLRRWLPDVWGWRSGGAEFSVNEVDDMVSLHWPAGWTVLRAFFQDRELDIRPSRPGGAALSLMEGVDDAVGIDPLLGSSILAEIQRLSEPSGRSWFEDKIRDIGRSLEAGGEQVAVKRAALEQRLSELAGPADEHDFHELTRDSLRAKASLSNSSANAWIEWAEDRELIVRGTRIRCGHCGATHWRSVGELAPPVICPGCGRAVRRPYGAHQVTFLYRAGERLRQTVLSNALPHVLAARWCALLLRNHGLFGVHPGIEVLEDDHPIGELDVVVLFRRGELAIGECKRTPGGLRDEDVEKHEALADRLGADWTFYSVPAWREECSKPWDRLTRELPDRPRFILTNEQLLTPEIEMSWRMGTNPFVVEAATAEQRDETEARFAERLANVREFSEPDWDSRLLDN